MNHHESLEETLDGSGLKTRREHTALVSLARTLAGQMDTAGDEPSTRLTAAYLSTLKDVRRAILDLPPEKVGHSKLDELRGMRQRPAPTKQTGV